MPFDIMTDKLTNDKPKKYAAYTWFGSQGMLQNSLTLLCARMLTGFSRSGVTDMHACPKEMENLGEEHADTKTLFLYHS